MKFVSLIGSSDRKKGSVLFDREGQETKKRLIVKTTKDIYRIWNKKKKETKEKFLFEAPRDRQPILCFNIITRRKRYSLFPILSGLSEPSLRHFRISLLNGLFSTVGIGGSIPSLRTVLESFLPHTARQPTLLFWCTSFLTLTYFNFISKYLIKCLIE